MELIQADTFLKEQGLYDDLLTIQQRITRYNRFSKVNFGDQISQAQKEKYLRQLLPFEDSFADSQDSIGSVDKYPYTIEVNDESPIFAKAIQYPPNARAWLKQECETLQKRGVIRKIRLGEPEPIFVCNIVLVPQGQSGQDFRMCYNAIPINARTTVSRQHVPECMTVIDSLSGAKYMSLIDLKGAFFNFKIAEHCKKYFGFVTQDGLYQFERMPFGSINAPGHLQTALLEVVHEYEQLPTEIYFDDITPHGNTIDEVWNCTLKTIAQLAKYNFMINLNKTSLIVESAKLLGFQVFDGCYQLGQKSLDKLFKSQIPTTANEVSQVVGRLNFASRLIPGFKSLIKPIEKLLGGSEDTVWEQQHTNNLNQLFQLAAQRLTLHIYAPHLPLLVYYSCDDEFCEVIFTQISPSGEYPIKFMTRELSITEKKYTEVEKALSILHWGLQKGSKYSSYHSIITIFLHSQDHLNLIKIPSPHIKIQAKVLDIQIYGAEFAYRPDAWDFGGCLARAAQIKSPLQLQPCVAPQIQHQDTIVRSMGSNNKIKAFNSSRIDLTKCWKAYFDGGSRKGNAAGGYVIFDKEDNLVAGGAVYFGPGTNNEAEARACEILLERATLLDVPQGIHIAIHGDSKLIISFISKLAKPTKRSLQDCTRRCHAAIKAIKAKITFHHIKRELNHFCDSLCQWALKNKDSKDISSICPSFSNRNDELILAFTESGAPEPLPPCYICAIDTEQEDLECWGCESRCHRACAADPYYRNNNVECPWYCPHCKHTLSGVQDITLDLILLKYIADSTLPSFPDDQDRVISATKYIFWANKRLWIYQKEGHRQVPPIKNRYQIIKQTAEQLAFPGVDRLCALLRSHFWWKTLRHDCIAFCKESVAKQIEESKFKPPPHLFPIPKGYQPFSTWAIDCITNMQPASNGGTTIILAIDAWSKWIEYSILQHHNSLETARFLYNQIITRYGVPGFIRCDSGREFMGHFDILCDQFGIVKRQINTLHPRANGQIERYNREIKSGLRKFISIMPSIQWEDALPDIIWGLRILPSTTTGRSPFELVFKQPPTLPLPLQITSESLTEYPMHLEFEDPASHELHYQKLVVFWQEIQTQVTKRLAQQDDRMKRSYFKRKDLGNINVLSTYKPGDQVIHRQKRPGKLLSRALGPYTFVSYQGQSKHTAIIADISGKRIQCSVANLLPLRTSTVPTKQPSASSIDFSLSDGSEPPEGVIVVGKRARQE